MGLLVSVAAPVLLLVLGRAAPQLDRWSLPVGVTLPGFVVLHAAVTVYDHSPAPLSLEAAAHMALLAGAVLFWAPVLGARRRLPDAGRMLYLFAAMPPLDLAGVWLVAVGDSAEGLSMIVGMLPMGLAAVVITWKLDQPRGAAGGTRRDGRDGRHDDEKRRVTSWRAAARWLRAFSPRAPVALLGAGVALYSADAVWRCSSCRIAGCGVSQVCEARLGSVCAAGSQSPFSRTEGAGRYFEPAESVNQPIEQLIQHPQALLCLYAAAHGHCGVR